MALLPADSVIGLKDGDSGIVNLCRLDVLRAVDERRGLGRTKGDGGTRGADAVVAEAGAQAAAESMGGGARRLDSLAEIAEKLAALGGCVMGVRWPFLSVKLNVLKADLAVIGVDMAGDRACK